VRDAVKDVPLATMTHLNLPEPDACHKVLGKSAAYEGMYLPYVSGHILSHYAGSSSILSRGALHFETAPQLLHFLSTLGLAVKTLHDHGIVHGDLHDRNVVVDDKTGAATVIDLVQAEFFRQPGGNAPSGAEWAAFAWEETYTDFRNLNRIVHNLGAQNVAKEAKVDAKLTE